MEDYVVQYKQKVRYILLMMSHWILARWLSLKQAIIH